MDSDDYEEGSSDPMEESDDMGGNDTDEDFGYDPGAEVIISSRKVPYKVLTKQELLKRQQESVEEVTNVLSIEDEAASRVLRKFKWDVNRVHEEWFSDMDSVRQSVGIQDPTPPTPRPEATCLICFDAFPKSQMHAAACHHYFCPTCWVGYISNAIASGPPCLELRCPLPECKACVPVSLVKQLVNSVDWKKYETFALRSFVEDNRRMCWCTGKGCENAVECLVDRAAEEPLDVMCTCSSAFCFNCKEEAHRPVSCETVRKWITKNSAESENLNWILANTKPCPKCHRPIEKNQGCMHMTCSQCTFEFCWLCQGDWKEHGEKTGGFYACNRYETAKKKGELDDETKRRDNAKHSLERYMHYFERWDAHHKARDKAKADAAKVSQSMLEKLSDSTKTPTSQLKFIMDAWKQIIECRRILSWTYTFGYYQYMEEAEGPAEAPADPKPAAGPSKSAAAAAAKHKGPAAGRIPAGAVAARSAAMEAQARQREFFEFLQGDAERSLERLHEEAENKLTALLQNSAESFLEFRKNLIGLTDVTHQFFDRLVQQLERGFATLQADYATQEAEGSGRGLSSAGPSFDMAPSSSTAAAAAGASTSAAPAANGRAPAAPEAAGGDRRLHKRGRRGAPAGGRTAADELTPGDEDMVDAADEHAMARTLLRQQGFWTCTHCTFDNEDLDADTCEMCAQPRAEG